MTAPNEMRDQKSPPPSGSYAAGDVEFLLEMAPADAVSPVAVAEKERLIQSAKRHYSEMISHEARPSSAYLALFRAALDAHCDRFATDLAGLARAIATERPDRPLVLVSLARAGTPIGVLLKRGVAALGRDVRHYSVSIIRDRGLDAVAMAHVQATMPDAHIVFVDGWTGKGAIARELARSTRALNAQHGWTLPSELVVAADPAGVARLAAGGEDYLIPNAILNATVSGLISRSILNEALVGPGDFHACLFYGAYADVDQSRFFVDQVSHAMLAKLPHVAPAQWSAADRAARARSLAAFLPALMARYRVTDQNRVKPGIGEATRAVLRREPDRLLIRQADDPDLAHLQHLAEERGLRVDVTADMPPPWRATAIIKTLGAG